MNYSMRDLMNMLRSNPDIAIDDPYIHQPVIGLAQAVPMFKQSEHDLQQAVIDECDRRAISNPLYGLIFCIPNGQYRKGQRMEPGLRPGVPDLFLPVARRGYHGMFLELKVGSNQPSEMQKAWLKVLQEQGYFWAVCWDTVGNAMKHLEWYLSGH